MIADLRLAFLELFYFAIKKETIKPGSAKLLIPEYRQLLSKNKKPSYLEGFLFLSILLNTKK